MGGVRSDNDSWDITTSVGSTALFVAAARALEARKPDPLAVDSFAEVFCRAAGGMWSGLLDGSVSDHPLRSEEFGTHFVAFQAARTRYFDAYFRAAAAAGVRQIVLLAAGLDSRAYRLDWPAGTIVFELDQPRVLEFKRETLNREGFTPKAKRREVAVDLRDHLGQEPPRCQGRAGGRLRAPAQRHTDLRRLHRRVVRLRRRTCRQLLPLAGR